MKRLSLTLLLISSMAIAIAACGSDDSTTTAGSSASAARTGPTVVASTAWTGALAQAAGAGKVTLIAPANVQHPSDYEPKPSDLTAVAKADFVVLAQYDAFAKQLRDATGSSARIIALAPENSPAKIRADVTALGRSFKTPAHARAWLKTFHRDYRKLSAQTKAAAAGKTAIAQVFMAPWAGFAGVKLVGTYGPKPMTPSQLGQLKAKKAQLLFENSHVPQGAGLQGDGTAKVSLINYPAGLDLLEVFRKNAAAIQTAAG